MRQVAAARGAAGRAISGADKRLHPQLAQTGVETNSFLTCDDLVSAEEVPVGALIDASGRRAEAAAAQEMCGHAVVGAHGGGCGGCSEGWGGRGSRSRCVWRLARPSYSYGNPAPYLFYIWWGCLSLPTDEALNLTSWMEPPPPSNARALLNTAPHS